MTTGEQAAVDKPKGQPGPGAGLAAQRAGAAVGAGAFCLLWFNNHQHGLHVLNTGQSIYLTSFDPHAVGPV